MRKILFIIPILIIISGCSKHTEDQGTVSLVTPSVTVTNAVKQTTIPSKEPTPTTVAQSVEDITGNMDYSDNSCSSMEGSNVDAPEKSDTDTGSYEALPFDEGISDILKNQMEQIKLGQKITLPKGYSLLEYSEGDINMDDQKDIAVVIQQDPGYASGSRCIYLFIQNNGKYNLQNVNSKIVLCSGEGGVWGDPYDSISIKDGEFHVYDYGGSADRWAHDYEFKMMEEKLYCINIYSGNITTCRYDLPNGILEKMSYNEYEEDSYVSTDFTYSGSFILDHKISFEEAEAWLEEELEINP